MMEGLRPTFNKMIVQTLPEDEVSRGGIILPPSAEKKQTCVGYVRAIGPGRITENGTLIPCCCKEGDKILFSRYGAGVQIEVNNEKFSVMPDVEAIMIFDSTAPDVVRS